MSQRSSSSLLSQRALHWLCRHVLIGPLLRLYGRPRITGSRHIPRRGPVILAANHLTALDSFYIALAANRPVYFLAKTEYFTAHGPIVRAFFRAMGQIPVERGQASSAQASLAAASRILADNGAWAIHPEGTRSPDGRMYRGHTGALRVALAASAPIIPIAITYPGSSRATPLRRVEIAVLPPLALSELGAGNYDDIRSGTELLMEKIRTVTGQEYVADYARSFSSARDS